MHFIKPGSDSDTLSAFDLSFMSLRCLSNYGYCVKLTYECILVKAFEVDDIAAQDLLCIAYGLK